MLERGVVHGRPSAAVAVAVMVDNVAGEEGGHSFVSVGGKAKV